MGYTVNDANKLVPISGEIYWKTPSGGYESYASPTLASIQDFINKGYQQITQQQFNQDIQTMMDAKGGLAGGYRGVMPTKYSGALVPIYTPEMLGAQMKEAGLELLAPSGQSGQQLGADYQLTPTLGPQAGMTLASQGGAGFVNPAGPAGGSIVSPGSTFQTYNPQTGQTTFNNAPTGSAAGAAIKPPAGATLISGPSGLKGLTESQIWRDPSSNQIYKLPQATLTSSTGERKVVTVGSQEASNLLNQGWTLGNKVGGGTITPGSFTNEPKIDTTGAGGTTGGTSLADQTVSALQASVDNYLKALKAGAATEKKQRDDMLSSLISSLKTDVSKESMQLEENAKYGISAIDQAKAQANTELQIKLAEIEGLDKSYQNANLVTEGKVITLGRMQGQMNQNLREYTIKKNLLTSEASLLQAKYLGLSGQLEAAQKAADRAVDLKYADQMYTTNNKIKMLELLQGQLDEENEEYRWAMTQTLQDQRTALSQKMDFEKMDYNARLDLMAKYPDAGITMTDTQAQIKAKLPGSKIYQDQVRPPEGNVGTASSYFTRPKADGTIGYYFGNPKNPGVAQEISQDAYNQGLGKDGGTVYDDNYIARQTAQYIASDGTVDWEGINTLQNVDKVLWQKVAAAANNYLNEVEKPSETTAQPTENKPIFGVPKEEAAQNWKNIGQTVKESYSNFFGNLFGF